MSNNDSLKALPQEFGNLTSLEYLYAPFNAFSTLPPEFGKLQNLQRLYLSDCKYLTILPEEFGDLKNLKYLDFFQSRLRELPQSFGDLQALRELDLGTNSLVELPLSFGRLKSLAYLNLYQNALQALPDSIISWSFPAFSHRLEEFPLLIRRINVNSNNLCGLSGEMREWLDIYSVESEWEGRQHCR